MSATPGNERTRRALGARAGGLRNDQQHTPGGYASQDLCGFERAVLGTCLAEPQRAGELVPMLSADLFIDPVCRAVARAIIQSHEQGQPVDAESVFHAMPGTMDRLWFDDAIDAASEFSFMHHVETLKAARDQRRRIEVAGLIHEAVENGVDTSELILELQAIGADTEHQDPVQIVAVDEWLQTEPERIDPVFIGLLDKSTKSLIVGPSKARKSFFTLQTALCMATGRDLFEWRINRRMTVLLIQAEIHTAHFRRRVENMVQALGIDPAELDRLHVLNGRGLNLTRRDAMDSIIAKAVEIGADVVIVDPLYSIMSGDETDQKAVREVLSVFDKIIEATGCALIVVHHTTKGHSGDRQAIDRAAGSGLFARHCDSMITLSPHSTADDAVVIETITRGHPPREAFCLQWMDGCFNSASYLPATPKTSFSAKRESSRASVTDAQIMTLFSDGPLPRGRFIEALTGLGLSRDSAREARARLLEDGTLVTLKRGLPATSWHGTPEQIEKLKSQLGGPAKLENTGDFSS